MLFDAGNVWTWIQAVRKSVLDTVTWSEMFITSGLYTPLKVKMENNNEGLVLMIFLF